MDEFAEGDTSGKLTKQFEKYRPTLVAMAQSHPAFSNLTQEDITKTWEGVPPGEKRAIILLGAFQRFIWDIALQPMDVNQQKLRIKKDAWKKGGPKNKFGEYSLKLLDIFTQMYEGGEISGFWYISQAARRDEIETDLDSLGADWMLRGPDNKYYLAQAYARPRDTNNRFQRMIRLFSEKFGSHQFIGAMPLLDESTRTIPDDDVLKQRARLCMSETMGFDERVLMTAFPERPRRRGFLR